MNPLSSAATSPYLPFRHDQIAVVSITRHGIALAGRVVAALPGAHLFAPEKYRAEAEAAAPQAFTCFSGKTGDQIPALFAQFAGIVCVVSLGAVVRLIAPHLQSKDQDPGVVVLDEAGRFSIPMLSGHLGGANALAQRIADALGAQPVFTTASDARETLAVDIMGREYGWQVAAPKDNITNACAAVVNDDPVAVVQECAHEHAWWTRPGPVPAHLHTYARLEEVDPQRYRSVLWISQRDHATLMAEQPALMDALADKLVCYRPAEKN